MNASDPTPPSPGPASNRTIRWGILGTGRIASSFAQGLSALPDAELVAVGSRTPESAASFASRFGIPHACGSYRELVQLANIDVVYIATPNIRHKEDCLLCIDAGKAVLCEKPFAMNAVDAQEIVDRAWAKGVFFMEAMWMRFIPAIQKARELLRRGEIGKPWVLQADFGFPIDRDPHGRFLNLGLGGGSLLDRGIYPLSLAWFLFGAPVEIAGQAAIGPTGVDEQSTVLLKYAGGQLAVLTSTMNAFGTNSGRIIGAEGQIEIADPFFKSERLVVTKSPGAATRTAASGAAAPAPDSPLRKILRRVKRAVFRLAGRRSDQNVHAMPLAGNGYNYEAAEVGRCLREGALESAVMPGSESVAIIKAMDALRAQWGIAYPNDP